MTFSPNSRAASNDTACSENGQESAISVVSKVLSSDHGQDEGYKGRRNSNVGGHGGGTEVENSEEEGHGWGKKRCIFQRLPSILFLFVALVTVLGMSSFASAVPILANESDTSGAAMATTGDSIPLEKAASDSSWPLLKQVEDMLDSSKASIRVLATGETTESSEEMMDNEVVEWGVIAKSPRYENAGGVDELQEMSAIMTLLNNHLSDPEFISSIPEQMRNSIQMLQQEMTNTERVMEQIESIIVSSQIDSSSSSRSGDMDRIANANTVKREYEQSITSQRRVLNEGSTTDQYEQDASQEDSPFQQEGKGSSRSFPFHKHQETHARNRDRENVDELLYGQGRHARARMNWQEDRSRRRLNTKANSFCASVEDEASQNLQKNAQCARLAECAKDYSLYDLFVYIYGDDIDFTTGTIDKRVEAFNEINIRTKLQRIKDFSANLLGPSPEQEKCNELLRQFHRFDEEIGAFGGIWQGGSVTSVCRGQGTSKFLSLQSIAQIMISLYKSPGSTNPELATYKYGIGPGKMPNATFFAPDGFLVDIFEEFVGCAVSFYTKSNLMHINPILNPFFSLHFTGRYRQTAQRRGKLHKFIYRN